MKKAENKGITLIALVITIIVLLILAGVTISMLLGENGILNQATNSKLRTDIAREVEQIKVSALGSYQENGKIPYSIFEEQMSQYVDVTDIEGVDTKAGSYQLVSKVKKPANLSNLFMPVSYATDGEGNPNFAKITYITERIYYIRLNNEENGDPAGSIYAPETIIEIANVTDQNNTNGTYGNNTYGNNTYGNNTYGNNTYGKNTYGNNTYGNNTSGNNTSGNSTYGNYTEDWNYSGDGNSTSDGNTTGGSNRTYPPQTVIDLREGDRVIYTDNNGIERACYVLYDSTDYNYASYGVQIITEDTVQDVEIGNGTGSSDESSDNTAFEVARNAYNNAISNLNNIAMNYVNSNLVSDARCVGSLPGNKNYKNSTPFSIDEEWFGPYINQFDEAERIVTSTGNLSNLGNASYDINQLIAIDNRLNNRNNEILGSDSNYLLATRSISSSSSSATFYVCMGGASDANLYNYHTLATQLFEVSSSGGKKSKSYTRRFRPVFTLKSDVEIEVRANGDWLLVNGN